MREVLDQVGLEDQENRGCLYIKECDTCKGTAKNKIKRGYSYEPNKCGHILVKIRSSSLPATLPHLDRTTITVYELFLQAPGQLVCLDLRERWQFNAEHVVGARNYNCSTKSLARHAVKLFEHTMPVPEGADSFPKTDTEAQNVLIAYDASSVDVSSSRESVRFFINSLINLGFRVLFVQGGFVAIKELADLAKAEQSKKEWLTSTPDTETESVLRRRPHTGETPHLDHLSLASTVKEHAESCRLPSVDMDTTSPDKIPPISMVAPKRPGSNEPRDDYLQMKVSRILPHLYLGNYQDAANLSLLKRLGVTHILNVTQDLPMAFEQTNSFHYLRLPALDSAEQNIYPFFEKAIEFIDGARETHGVVLVHCLAGISRSASIVMAYMLYHTPLTVLEAYKLLQSLRPIADPNFAFLGQLDSFRRLINPDNSNKSVTGALMNMWKRLSVEEENISPTIVSAEVPPKRHLWPCRQRCEPFSLTNQCPVCWTDKPGCSP